LKLKKKGSESRTNEVLKDTIKTCMEYEITNIHLVFFVCSFNSGIQKEDLRSFSQFASLFKGAEAQMAILITRAENYDNERKIAIVRELYEHQDFSKYIDLVGDRIYFTGAIDPDLFKMGLIDSLTSQTENVLMMRKILYDLIFETEESTHIKKLSFYTDQEVIIRALLAEIKEIQIKLGFDETNIPLSELLEKKLDDLNALKDFARFSAGIDDVNLLLETRKRIKKDKEEELTDDE